MAGFSSKQQLTFDWAATGPSTSAKLPEMPQVSAEPKALGEEKPDIVESRTAQASALQDAGEQTIDVPIRSGAPRKPPARLPVPKPLPSAVGKGNFGQDEAGPVRPSAEEIRAITEQYADRLIELFKGKVEVEAMLANPVCSDRARLYHEKDRLLSAIQSGLAVYAEDFGQPAANRLESYVLYQFDLRRREGR
jgi:hypothetical protein